MWWGTSTGGVKSYSELNDFIPTRINVRDVAMYVRTRKNVRDVGGAFGLGVWTLYVRTKVDDE